MGLLAMPENTSSFVENEPAKDDQIRFKILVVDEPGSYLQNLVNSLQGVGYNVDFASDSETTYRKLKSSVRPVDMLIIDLEFTHDVDRLLFLKVLKKEELCKGSRIIITSHFLLDEKLVRARDELAIYASFNKSRPIEELLYLVTAVLPPGGQNLRTLRRVPVRFLVRSVVGKTSQLHQAANLSLDGIFILNSRPDPVRTLARLTFSLPETAILLNAEAKVVRVIQYASDVRALHYQSFPPGNGLVFLKMSEEHQSLLKQFCDQEETRIFKMPPMMMTNPQPLRTNQVIS